MRVLPLRGCAGSDSSASDDEPGHRSGFLSFRVVRPFFVRGGAESVESGGQSFPALSVVPRSGPGLPTFPQPHPAAASAATRFGLGALAPNGRHPVCAAQGLAGFAQGVGNHDELAGDGRDDNLVRLPLFPQPIGEQLQVRIVNRGDKRGLVQNLPERPAAAADHPLPAHLSAVPRDGREPRERGGLLSGDPAELGHLRDRHRANHRADPRNRLQDGGGLGQDGFVRKKAPDPLFHLSDLALQQLDKLAGQVLDRLGRAVPQIRFGLLPRAFAHLDELLALGRRRPEIPQPSARQPAAGLRAERHEAGDQFGVDPVRLGQSAPASPEGFRLRRRKLPRFDPCRLQACPKTPFVAARGLEADQSLPVAGDRLQLRMAFVRVRQAEPAVVAQAMDVEPIARDVQANDLRVCYSVHSLFLPVRGP